METRTSRFEPLLDAKRRLWSAYWFLQGNPRSVSSEISGGLLQACIGKRNPTILEIGANVGQTTAWFLDLFEDAKIYCFEPDPRACARFEEKIGNDPRVKLYRMALSDRVGTANFYQSSGHDDGESVPNADDWNQSGSLRKPTGHLETHPWVKFENTLEVQTSTLDTWYQSQKIEAVDLIWMDVQGAEMDVLRGGEKAVANTRYLYTEYSNTELYAGQPRLSDIQEELSDFRVLVRYPGDALLWNERLGSPARSAYLRAFLTYLK